MVEVGPPFHGGPAPWRRSAPEDTVALARFSTNARRCVHAALVRGLRRLLHRLSTGRAARPAARRQLRLVHPQPRRPVRAAGRRRVRRAQRRVGVREALAAGAAGVVLSPGPLSPREAGRVGRAGARVRARRPAGPAPRRLPRPPGGRRGLRRRGSCGRDARSTAARSRSSTRGRGCSRGCPARSWRRATTPSSSIPCVSPGRWRRRRSRPTARSWRCVTERLPIEGVQFHPESYLTPVGPRLLAAFLARCGIASRRAREVVR